MTQQTLGWHFGIKRGNLFRLLAFTGICKYLARSVWEINKITLGVMTGNSPWGKILTIWNRQGSNISPGKKGITIVICHLGKYGLVSWIQYIEQIRAWIKYETTF